MGKPQFKSQFSQQPKRGLKEIKETQVKKRIGETVDRIKEA